VSIRNVSLIEHLEQHCGPIVGGSAEGVDGNKAPFQVVQMLRGPVKGAVVLSTLGLSNHVLHTAAGRQLRMELVMLHRELDRAANLPGILQQVGADILRAHQGPSRGDVFGPRGPLTPGATVEALYVASPVYFPDSFHFYVPSDGTAPIVMAWLVPITAAEAAFVHQEGSTRFEEALTTQNPDLLDFGRPCMSL
jgi:hypothetical protein